MGQKGRFTVISPALNGKKGAGGIFDPLSTLASPAQV